MLDRAPPSKDGVAKELIQMDEWVQKLRVAQEEARKLILANIKSEQQDCAPSVENLGSWQPGHSMG